MQPLVSPGTPREVPRLHTLLRQKCASTESEVGGQPLGEQTREHDILGVGGRPQKKKKTCNGVRGEGGRGESRRGGAPPRSLCLLLQGRTAEHHWLWGRWGGLLLRTSVVATLALHGVVVLLHLGLHWVQDLVQGGPVAVLREDAWSVERGVRLFLPVGDEAVTQGLLSCETAGRVDGEQPLDQVHGILRDVLPPRLGEEHPAVDLLQQLLALLLGTDLPGEGGRAGQHNVKHHADRPHVNKLHIVTGGQQRSHPMHLDAADDLRRDIKRGTAWGGVDHVVRQDLGQPEIGEADVVDVVDEDVLGLDVAVHNGVVVKVGNCGEQHLAHFRRVLLTQLAVGADPLVQVRVHLLQHHVDVLFGFDALVELDNRRLMHPPQDLLFVRHHVRLLPSQLRLVHHLHGSELSGFPTPTDDNLGECTSAHDFCHVDVILVRDAVQADGRRGGNRLRHGRVVQGGAFRCCVYREPMKYRDC
eukprot:Sspe_Gene.76644::Locus_47889_Transcript_1_1_Confidence_1.000_Length_1593::g.76644::m.76644